MGTKKINPLLIIGGFLIIIIIVVILITLIRRQPDDNLVSDDTSPEFVAEPLVVNACEGEALLSQLSPEKTGVAFQNTLSAANQYRYIFNGAGVTTGDYNNDGLTDIYLVSEEGINRLYQNQGNLRFVDVTEEAGLLHSSAPGGFNIGAYFADINNDGYLDLFLTNWKTSNRLFQNNGDGTFTDVTEQAGVAYEGGATTATFADYDRDGDLDFFVATYRPQDFADEFGQPQLVEQDGALTVPPYLQDRLELVPTDGGLTIRQLGERDLLYRNNGDGTFTEVAAEAGIEGGYWGLSAAFSDVDNDGWPDLYVTNDFWSPDGFYHNEGDGTFKLVSADMVQHTPMSSMGIDFADINNDGLTDYFIGDMVSRDHNKRMTQHGMMDMSPPPAETAPQLMRNSLYLNNGDGSFSDIAWLADVAASEWSWTSKFADLDLDGFVDLIITNGMIGDLMDSDVSAQLMAAREAGDAGFVPEFPPLRDRDLVFRNNGDLTFSEVSSEWGFNTEGIGHGAAIADFDNDGDWEIVVNYLNQQAEISCNNSTNPRVVVQLRGSTSNRFGLGAQVALTTDHGVQTRQMTTSGGYLSGHDPIIIFGLGEAEKIEALRVEWPSGQVQTFPDESTGPLMPGRKYTIYEPEHVGTILVESPGGAEQPLFTEVSEQAGLTRLHQESEFDDFAEQILLPRQLSTLGPGLAWGDADGDGDDDLYVAGAAGQTGTLYLNNPDGFAVIDNNAGDLNFEEMAPLWWHSEISPLPTLLLTYSRVEVPDSPAGGAFNLATSGPIQMEAADWDQQTTASGGTMASSDFDGDGDLDLFVAGRLLAGRWPLAAPSRLYINDNGRLTDMTAQLAPELENLGLATGAVWTDFDNDGDGDLVVATEWGPLRLFVNDNGRLQENTAASNLSQWTGLWNGVTSADFNHDGFMDLAATNLGLNTKYTASPDQPAVLFAGDVDADNDLDLVEAYYIGDTLYPLRERGMSGAEMPFILEKYDTFRAFGEATLAEIYGDRLQNTTRFEANTLAHMVFINDGNGHFNGTPLPQLAQITAGYGITSADFDNDGRDDIYLAGNFSYADHETMRYGGGISYLLQGQGDGTFIVMPAANSGLNVPYDARGVAVSDYDQDGWMDIAVAINNGRPMLYKNQGGAGACGLTIRLKGPLENPTAVGSRIAVTLPDGSVITREVQAGGGYLSQDSAVHIIGLGQATQAEVLIHWPDGSMTSETQVPACQAVEFSW